MENTRGIPVLGALALLYAFSLVFALSTLGTIVDPKYMENVGQLYTFLAFIGFILALGVSLIFGITMQSEGVALSLYFFGFAIIDFITLIWFTTRVGNIAGFL